MPVHSQQGTIWQYRDRAWEAQCTEPVINMAFPLEKENLRTLFLVLILRLNPLLVNL